MKKIETSQSREDMKENRNSQHTQCKKRVSHLQALGKKKKKGGGKDGETVI